MISQETLEAVRAGILTDYQLDQAIEHYRKLDEMLSVHGEIYFLVRRDVTEKLRILEGFKRSRDSG